MGWAFQRGLLAPLLPILTFMMGMLLVVGPPALVPSPKLATLVIFALFIAYNVVLSRWLNLKSRLENAWSMAKVWHLLPGFFIGALPVSVAYMGLFMKNELPEFKGMTVSVALLILATVSWEELWFRGMCLELAASRYTKIGATVIFAVIFAALHVLNPKIDLLVDGVPLFLAGYALGACYFAFNSIWAPIGMHFANNSIQALFGQSTEPRTFLFVIPLLLIAIGFTAVIRKSSL